jgi:hypothetical protein
VLLHVQQCHRLNANIEIALANLLAKCVARIQGRKM